MYDRSWPVAIMVGMIGGAFVVGDARGAGAQSGPDVARVIASPSDTVGVAERVLLIGNDERDRAGVFFRVGGIAVAHDGRFAVLDRSAADVRVFSPGGELLLRFGRQGRGPGELSDEAAGIAFDEDGSIVVLDPGNDRITVFGPDGERVRTIPLRGRGRGERITAWRPLRPGVVLERIWSWERDTDRLRLRFLPDDSTRTVVDFEYEPAINPRRMEDPIELLGTRPVWTGGPDGAVAWSYTEPGSEPRLWIWHPDGRERTVRPEGHAPRTLEAWERSRLLEAGRSGWAELLGREPQQITPLTDRFALPDSLPAVTGLHALGGGGFLVQGVEEVEELDGAALFSYFNLPLGGARWTLVDGEGNTLGRVALPGGFEPWASSGDLVYGVDRDPLGVERVAVYRLDLAFP